MPAFAVTALLLAAGCSAPPPTGGRPVASGNATARQQQDDSAAAPDRTLAVAAAPATAAAAAASPDGARGSGGRGPAHRTSLTVDSYDSHTRRAVISTHAHGTSAPTPGAGAKPHGAAVGDVIASAPAPGAPHGLLAKVTRVIGETGRGTEVQTEPAALNSVLGDRTARGSVPVSPASFDIDRLLPDVKVSWSKPGDVHVGPKGTTVPLGSLRLDVGANVPTAKGAPVSAAASVSGFVQVAPRVDFRYGGQGTDTAPGSAYLGVSGDWTSGWALKGRAAASATPLRIPFAKLHADPVLQVGPVPVVVNLDLTCYLQISGDGRVTVDVEQNLKGGFTAGGAFGPAHGWTPVSSADMTSTPVRSSLTSAGGVKAALGAEATVGLYGTVGVSADLAPYLRGEASGSVTGAVRPASGTGAAGGVGARGAGPAGAGRAKAGASWGLYGGVDLTGTLRLQLSVFGTPVFERSIPLGSLHREWRLAGGGTAGQS
ncbi:hypothetical protein ACH4UM_22875 [Streptomyces sp. NPDC020801]|uniref:hypothetical protein n=1 Tax=unclassified Streptomyces TaxID=2593676 RepID=UPI003791929B